MINNVVLVGRLVSVPELKKSEAGTYHCSFTLAVDSRQKNADGEKESSFIGCKAFGASAQFLFERAGKGSLVGVVGRLVQRRFTRKDGTNGSVIEIICDSVQFLRAKADGDDSQQNNDSTLSLDDGFDSDFPVKEAKEESKNIDDLDNLSDDDLPFGDGN